MTRRRLLMCWEHGLVWHLQQRLETNTGLCARCLVLVVRDPDERRAMVRDHYAEARP